ncbi:MAG TPA: DMT family transporter, partial [Thermoleophilia bacterium]|nr:DMT family transporter [Thermoleophilia bacterium]
MSARQRGHLIVAVAFLVIGVSGPLVRMADAPESVLIVIRMASAAIVVAAFSARRRTLAPAFQSGIAGRLLLMGACSASSILLFFVALRGTDVAMALFLLYTSPVYVALLAPFALGEPSHRVVYLALTVALTGMAVIVMPDLLGRATEASPAGIAAGIGAGALFAFYTMVAKTMTRRLGNRVLLLSETALDALFILPLALWQIGVQGYSVTGRDLVIGLVLGLVCTVFAYALWYEGIRHIPVQHASILGYLALVSGPVCAFFLL